jgi:tetratricopeptide (TPR) repeat protein
LLQQFPGSMLAGEARLLLADAFREAGDPDDARAHYVRIAEAQAGTALGVEAYARLGQMAYDRGQYKEAIEQLNACLSAAVTAEGGEKLMLLLAQSYRADGQGPEARRVLNELIDSYPETETAPLAFIELCRVLDELGMHAEAMRLSGQTALDYPEHVEVLKNHARMLESDGDAFAAAEAWLAADRAGAKDPAVLLSAARDYHTAGALSESIATYDLLIFHFALTPEAFEGCIEMAQVQYESGQVTKAVETLENVALATDGKPQRLPVLLALGAMYRDLALWERVAEVYGQIAVVTTEAEVLAQAATAIFEAGALIEGLAVAERIDVAKLPDPAAYTLLMAQGGALMKTDPRQALDKMERAYQTYPAQRTSEGEMFLLRAYLAMDNAARARAVVMNIDIAARQNPGNAPRLREAAVAWGDYLFDRRDFRTAADAYALAIGAVAEDSPDVSWAKYQRANALLRLSDFDASVQLYDEVASSGFPWAEDARVSAEYARMEQRMRGMPVTPVPAPAKEG